MRVSVDARAFAGAVRARAEPSPPRRVSDQVEVPVTGGRPSQVLNDSASQPDVSSARSRARRTQATGGGTASGLGRARPAPNTHNPERWITWHVGR
jgi:hypothetical protein